MSTSRLGAGRIGIGGRLNGAFLGVGLLTVVACVVAFLSYDRLSRELGAIAEAHLPGLAFSARLAETGAKVIASTPDLALAERPEAYERIRNGLTERLRDLGSVLEERAGLGLSAELLVVTDAIRRNLAAIDVVAGQRFPLEQQLRTITDELRWIQADLLEEIEPLIEDARFNVETALRRQAEGVFDGNAIRAENRRSEALLSVNAQANLIIGLLIQLATVPTSADLDQTINILGEISDQLDADTRSLAGATDSVTVRQIAMRLTAIADARSGMPATKRLALAASSEGQALLAENRRLVGQLGTLISQEVTRTETIARQAAERSGEAIRVGRNLLAAIALASLVVALFVGYFYVHRSLVRRLQLLTSAATAIAGGSPVVALPPPSNDELGDLSRALAVFRQTRDELVQAAKLAALGRMAAGLSHELNQPLAAIRAHAHNGALLLERGQSADARTNLDRIQALTTRMAELIKHLKRFSRRSDVALATVDLRQAVESALGLFRLQLEAETIQLEVMFPTEPVRVRAEEIRLEQVVVNLLSNAVDAVRGRAPRRIGLRVERAAGRVRLMVSDTGSGIDETHRKMIFDPFFTTKPVGDGLGLGLSISYNIARDFGGTLEVAASGTEGTTFALDLEEAR